MASRQLLRNHGENPCEQRLLVAPAGRRPVAMFSEFDLTAAPAGSVSCRSPGCKPESTRQIVGNLLSCLAAD